MVAHPDGVDNNWNDGRVSDVADPVDDVGFLAGLVDDVGGRVAIDPKQVFVTGVSNGAMMATRLACERPDLVAAFAPVAGTAAVGFEQRCADGDDVALLQIHGTADPLVRYEGGPVAGGGRRDRGDSIGVDALAAFWADRNGCVAEPRTSSVAGSVTRRTWLECDAAVEFLQVEGGGHSWPGGNSSVSERIVGPTTTDIDATETIWAFFAAHPKP